MMTFQEGVARAREEHPRRAGGRMANYGVGAPEPGGGVTRW